GYKNLLEAERSFRDLKGILRLRPVYHRLEERIRAHIVICWLALLLVRPIERQADDTWRNTRRELERLNLVTLAGAAGQVQQTTRLTPEQRHILNQLQIEPPPPLTSLTPALAPARAAGHPAHAWTHACGPSHAPPTRTTTGDHATPHPPARPSTPALGPVEGDP